MYIVPTSVRTCPSIASLRRTKTQILNANKTLGIIAPCINHKYTCTWKINIQQHCAIYKQKYYTRLSKCAIQNSN